MFKSFVVAAIISVSSFSIANAENTNSVFSDAFYVGALSEFANHAFVTCGLSKNKDYVNDILNEWMTETDVNDPTFDGGVGFAEGMRMSVRMDYNEEKSCYFAAESAVTYAKALNTRM